LLLLRHESVTKND